MSEPVASTKPFGTFERSLAWRYLRARKEHGGVALVAIISFIGIALAVTALIVTMSIMSGFRGTLLDTLLGGKGEVYVYVQQYSDEESDGLADQIRQLDGVKSVHGMHEGQVLAKHDGETLGAIVRVVRPENLSLYRFLDDDGTRGIFSAESAEELLAAGFGDGRNGGNKIIIGQFLASKLRAYPGSKVTLIGETGKVNPFGAPIPTKKDYIVAGIFRTGNVELDLGYIFMPMEQGALFFRPQEWIHAARYSAR